jgi:hypothetical protein
LLGLQRKIIFLNGFLKTAEMISLIRLFGIMGVGITALVRRKKTVAVEE